MASGHDGAVDARLAPAEVDLDAPDPGARVAAGLAAVLDAAQDRPHAGDELAGRERLRDVVVGAELEAEHAVDLAVARREHEDREIGVGSAAHSAAHLHAVDRARQPDVEDREHRLLVADQRPAPARRPAAWIDAEPRIAEVEIEQIGDVGIVLDDHDRLLSCHPPWDVIVRALRFF